MLHQITQLSVSKGSLGLVSVGVVCLEFSCWPDYGEFSLTSRCSQSISI